VTGDRVSTPPAYSIQSVSNRIGDPPRRSSSPTRNESPMPALDRKWWTLIAVCTATFMLLLDITVVNVALPDIVQ
jgi:hypothetical protein